MVKHREGGDPSTGRKSPGRTNYEAITLERGVTHDTEFETWANKVWNFGAGLGAEIVAGGLPQGHHHRRVQRGGTDSVKPTSLPLLGVGISGAARSRRQCQRGADPAHQARERGLGARRQRGRAEPAQFEPWSDPDRSMDFADVELPGGIRLDGSWRRDAVLRPLAGRDEAFLMQQGTRTLAGARTTAVLLARCLCRLGPVSTVTAEIARSLSVGDREALVLHLRCLTLGDTMSCVLTCPACAEKLDSICISRNCCCRPIRMRAICMRCRSARQTLHVGALSPSQRRRSGAGGGDGRRCAGCRGGFLLRRACRKSSTSGPERRCRPIPARPRRALAGKMAELDPQAEILLDLVCPACSETFRIPFDMADYFYRSSAGESAILSRDPSSRLLTTIGANGILRLSRRKRLRYLDLLSGLGRAGGPMSASLTNLVRRGAGLAPQITPIRVRSDVVSRSISIS